MKDRFLFFALIVSCLAAQPETQAQKRIAPYSQTPETLCRCSPNIKRLTGIRR